MKITTTAACVLVLSTSACGGGGADGPASTAPDGKTAQSSGLFSSTPVQLTVDPCALVTKAEAEALIGPVSDTPGVGSDDLTCVYVSSEHTGGQVAVNLQSPDFCKLLFLALDEDFFGGQQVRVDDVGDGGMQVIGNGNVQFVAKGGCVEVQGGVDYETKLDDGTILRVAKIAAGRVS